MPSIAGGRPEVLYDLDGNDPQPEREDSELEGYRASHPVRWGNAAAAQRQLDIYGEILDCAYQWASHHGTLDPGLWERLRHLVEAARWNGGRPITASGRCGPAPAVHLFGCPVPVAVDRAPASPIG